MPYNYLAIRASLPKYHNVTRADILVYKVSLVLGICDLVL